jgi:hypothetical protein
LGDVPEIQETLVDAGDLSLSVDNEQTVRDRIDGGLEE